MILKGSETVTQYVSKSVSQIIKHQLAASQLKITSKLPKVHQQLHNYARYTHSLINYFDTTSRKD